MSSFHKKKIISWLAPVLSGLGVHKLFEPLCAGIGHILTFHRVLPPSSDLRIHNHLSLEISPKQLEASIAFYRKRGYHFASLDEFHEQLQKRQEVGKMVAFTFDDGYTDNYSVAYPILKKHHIPFTIYITTNFPDRKAILWWYLLEDVLKEAAQLSFEHQGKRYQFNCQKLREKERTFDAVRQLINQSFSTEGHLELLTKVLKKDVADLYRYGEKMAMSWEEIKQLSQDPLCTIGAHTVNHYPLIQLDEKSLRYEILESKNRIEAHIGEAVEHFAYPFGKKVEAADREYAMVKKLGFKTATTTCMGTIFPAHEARQECLPRISINSVTNEQVLKLQASGMLPFLLHKGKKIA
ncbi:MAG: polysaccharide deacetylase family protein [Bacteroidota bacterium]